MIDKYYHSGGNKRLPPHIFGIADAAYKVASIGMSLPLRQILT
jgi:myosin heavy subunit